jgi:predicted Zn-dependent peptidase
VREQQLRTQEVSLKENSYWAGNIAARLENGEDPRGLATYTRDYIEKLTSDQIREAANRYLNMARYARFVLLPDCRKRSVGRGNGQRTRPASFCPFLWWHERPVSPGYWRN